MKAPKVKKTLLAFVVAMGFFASQSFAGIPSPIDPVKTIESIKYRYSDLQVNKVQFTLTLNGDLMVTGDVQMGSVCGELALKQVWQKAKRPTIELAVVEFMAQDIECIEILPPVKTVELLVIKRDLVDFIVIGDKVYSKDDKNF